MPLVTTGEMLLKAQDGGYAVGAFNVENMEMVQAVFEAAEEMRSPVILQTTPSTVRYAGLPLYYANVAARAEMSPVPAAMHLDHGSSFELAMQALRAGYTSIMIDGSKYAFEENIAVTKAVSAACNAAGVPVEAELGKVGGKEDDTESDGDLLTDPDQAAEFVRRTGISSLAVAIGTAHGVYHKEPKLNVERLSEIRGKVDVPLVLHGASGLSAEAVRECVRRGICKVNFATELRAAYTDALRKTLHDGPEVFDPKVYGAAGREAVKRQVMDRIRICGSQGKIDL